MRKIRMMFRRPKVDLAKDPETAEASAAARDARAAKARGKEHTGEIAVLSARMRKLRDDNHFVTLIRDAVIGGDEK